MLSTARVHKPNIEDVMKDKLLSDVERLYDV